MFVGIYLMLTGFDPAHFLTRLEIPHKRSSKPVDLLNFVDWYRLNDYKYDKPFICHFSEILPDNNDLVVKHPVALISAATYDQKIAQHKKIEDQTVVFYPEHLIMTYKSNVMLDKIRPIVIPDDKPFIADVLMGQPKLHRWMIVNRIIQHGLFDRCLVSLKQGPYVTLDDSKWMKRHFPKWGYPRDIISSNLDDYDEPEVTKIRMMDMFDTTIRIKTAVETVWASRILPTKIYDSCWLSIVAETDTNNGIFFPTEKTAKPLLDGRLFLAVSGKDYLKNLRKLGFETFHEFIDESYDSYDSQIERTDKMINTLVDVSKENLKSLYQKIYPILIHNQMLARSIQKMTLELVAFLQGLEVGIRVQLRP